MKHIYSLAFLLSLASLTYAQDSALAVCNHPDGGIRITFDYSKACANASGDLSGQTELGFHSGVNSWATAVSWDASGALTAMNDGNDMFTIHIADPATYYGESNITEYNFVFNQGITNSADPWAAEGKADNGTGGCSDFKVMASSITETCAMPLPPGIKVCNDVKGGIRIAFDLAENCDNAAGDLSGQSEIGFHSGANSWTNVVTWDAANAKTAKNDGNDVFELILEDPAAYYGTPTITDINFVFNQGPTNSSSPWDSEAKGKDEGGNCIDFKFAMSDVVETCPLMMVPVVKACNDPKGGIQLIFNYEANCPVAAGDLSGMTNIGFHSGVNSWATAVAWDAAGAVTGKNDGNDIFITYIADPSTYYGESNITEYNFVFNQGPADGANPWASEGKMDDGAGACTDFKVLVDDITETCDFSVSKFEPTLGQMISIYPNPATDQTTIMFNGTASEFKLSVFSITGENIFSASGIVGSSYTLDAQEFDAGIYFISIQDATGETAVKKFIVE